MKYFLSIVITSFLCLCMYMIWTLSAEQRKEKFLVKTEKQTQPTNTSKTKKTSKAQMLLEAVCTGSKNDSKSCTPEMIAAGTSVFGYRLYQISNESRLAPKDLQVKLEKGFIKNGLSVKQAAKYSASATKQLGARKWARVGAITTVASAGFFIWEFFRETEENDELYKTRYYEKPAVQPVYSPDDRGIADLVDLVDLTELARPIVFELNGRKLIPTTNGHKLEPIK